MARNIKTIKTDGLVNGPISWTHRTQNFSRKQNLYPHQSRITFQSLLWDTLYVKDLNISQRIWKNLKRLEKIWFKKIWKDLARSEKIWSWKDLKRFETLWKQCLQAKNFLTPGKPQQHINYKLAVKKAKQRPILYEK